MQINVAASDEAVEARLALAGECLCCSLEVSGSDQELLYLENSQVFRRCVSAEGNVDKFEFCGLYITEFERGHLADPSATHRRASRADLVRLMQRAAELGMARVSIAPAVVSSGDARRVNYQDALNHCHRGLESIIRDTQGIGVDLCIRVSCKGFLTSPPEARELIHLANSHAIGVDLSFDNRCDRVAWQDWVETLWPLVRVVGVELNGTEGSRAHLARAELAVETAKDPLTGQVPDWPVALREPLRSTTQAPGR